MNYKLTQFGAASVMSAEKTLMEIVWLGASLQSLPRGKLAKDISK